MRTKSSRADEKVKNLCEKSSLTLDITANVVHSSIQCLLMLVIAHLLYKYRTGFIEGFPFKRIL